MEHTGRLLAALLLAMGGTTGRAEGLEIQSFDGGGRLTFSRIPTGEVYRIEWANTATGVWTRLTAPVVVAGIPTTLDCIPKGGGGGTVTCAVPTTAQSMFFRTMADTGDMALIPGGTNSGTDPDFGIYSLTVESFYMDRTEVTWARWQEVRTWAAANGYTDLSTGDGRAADHPVQMDDWWDCVKWCNARSEMEGRTPVYYTDAAFTQVYRTESVLEPYVKVSANGYRLPTEVQWEYAARGGVANRRFPWSDTNTIQHARANYFSSSSYSYDTSPTRGYHPDCDDESLPYTSPAGSFAPNGYGLYDMAGNVMEWCYGWHIDYYGRLRPLRGGNWNSDAIQCRVACYDIYPPLRPGIIGFRAILPSGQQ